MKFGSLLLVWRRLTVHFLGVMSMLLVRVSLSLAQQLPKPESITDRQGLPQAFVPAIVQDHRGFI